MWIRSQDMKSLVNVSDVHIVSSYKVFGIYSGSIALGYYSTEKNAIKVIDMIENAIIDYEIAIHNKDESFYRRNIIFYMPEDNVLL